MCSAAEGQARMTAAARPRYLLVAEDLISKIVDGDYALGARLPTEAGLCTLYQVSRGTVRGALDQLESLGLITRWPGTGTRVVANEPVESYKPVARNADDIVDLVAKTKIKNPQSREITADGSLARTLKVELGSTWFLLEGPRVRRRTPGPALCWSQQYLRGSSEAKARERLRRGDFTTADMGLRIEQVISAALLRSEHALALDAEPNSAAIVITRRSFDTTGRVLSIGVHTHPSDRFEITTTVAEP
jgi:GntR family transcriptional regulator